MPINVRGIPLRTKVLLRMPGSPLNRLDPRFVAHYENGRRARFVVGGLRDSAVKSGQAEEFECAGGDVGAVEALGAFAMLVQHFFFGVRR